MPIAIPSGVIVTKDGEHHEQGSAHIRLEPQGNAGDDGVDRQDHEKNHWIDWLLRLLSIPCPARLDRFEKDSIDEKQQTNADCSQKRRQRELDYILERLLRFRQKVQESCA